VARFKLPKEFRFVEGIVRSPAGKADYRWAKEIALGQ
jgi:fatty-acyl-CoA synthase